MLLGSLLYRPQKLNGWDRIQYKDFSIRFSVYFCVFQEEKEERFIAQYLLNLNLVSTGVVVCCSVYAAVLHLVLWYYRSWV